MWDDNVECLTRRCSRVACTIIGTNHNFMSSGDPQIVNPLGTCIEGVRQHKNTPHPGGLINKHNPTRYCLISSLVVTIKLWLNFWINFRKTHVFRQIACRTLFKRLIILLTCLAWCSSLASICINEKIKLENLAMNQWININSDDG